MYHLEHKNDEHYQRYQTCYDHLNNEENYFIILIYIYLNMAYQNKLYYTLKLINLMKYH